MSAPREHELKIWPPYFNAVVDGSKTFELRRDDRGFAVGDVLLLREWEPTSIGGFGRYTARHIRCRVTYRLALAEWVPGADRSWVVLGIKLLGGDES